MTPENRKSRPFMLHRFTLLLICLLTTQIGWANTYYVDDTLRVGVRAEPDKSLPSLVVVKSGAAVELLERKGSYAKVRTSNGVEGWVKSAYLSNRQPAVSQLQKAQDQINELKSQIEAIKKEKQASASSEIQTLQQQITTLEQEKNTLQAKLAQAGSNINTPEPQQPATINRSIAIDFKNLNKDTLYIAGGVLVVILSLGFLFGVSWYKKQVTKRLGGLSI